MIERLTAELTGTRAGLIAGLRHLIERIETEPSETAIDGTLFGNQLPDGYDVDFSFDLTAPNGPRPYRGSRFTAAEYDRAIESLQLGKTQLEPNGHGCHICTESGHQAFECPFNPLVAMAICFGIAKHSRELHTFLHYLSGYEIHMGQHRGPAVVVPPSEELDANLTPIIPRNES